MRHLGWFLLHLTVSICFYVTIYHDAIQRASYSVLVSSNENYKLDLAAEHKDLKECMMTLPLKERNDIYIRHRKELAEHMIIKQFPREPLHQQR